MIKYIQILRYYHIHNIVCIWMIYHIKILMGILWWLMDINGDYRQMILGKKQCHKPRLYHKFMVKLGMVYCFTHIRWFDSSEFRLGLVTFALLLGLGHICSESFLSGQWFFVFFLIRTFCFSLPSATFLWGELPMNRPTCDRWPLQQVAQRDRLGRGFRLRRHASGAAFARFRQVSHHVPKGLV